MKTIEAIQANDLGPAAGPFSTAVKANGLLFLSGQIGTDNVGILATSFEAEVHQVLKNIGIILASQHLGYQHLVSVTIYLKDMDNFGKLNEIYRSYFNDYYPSRTCIAVLALPLKANVEITATALLKNG